MSSSILQLSNYQVPFKFSVPCLVDSRNSISKHVPFLLTPWCTTKPSSVAESIKLTTDPRSNAASSTIQKICCFGIEPKKCQRQSTCFGVIVSRENPTNLLWNTISQSKNLLGISRYQITKSHENGVRNERHGHTLACYSTKRRGTLAAIQTLLDRLATNKQRYLEQGICDPGQLDQISSGCWVGVGEVAGAPGTYMNHSPLQKPWRLEYR